MRKLSISFLKIVISFIAIGVFIGMVLFPQTEGRAANLDLISIYKDPFIIYVYIGSIPFFVGLYQAFRLLNLIGASKVTSEAGVNTLKNIKYSALSLIGFITLALLFIRFFANGDDPAGPTMLGFIVIFVNLVIATTASSIQNRLQNSLNLRSDVIKYKKSNK